MAREKSGFLSALGVLFQLFKSVVDDVLAAGGNDDDLRRIQADPELRKQIVKLIMSAGNSTQAQLQAWKKFYAKYFGLDLDLSSIKIPERRPGFDRLIVVHKGLTLNRVYDVCAKHFQCWRYADDLDVAIPSNDRDPKNGTYAVWVRDRVEADEENKGLSADILKEQGASGITELERMLYELKYWDETGQHLDVINVTLCSGSRYSDGRVPGAYWHSGKFGVSWYSPGSCCGGLRSRSALSA